MIKIKIVNNIMYYKGKKHLHTNDGMRSSYILSEWAEARGVDFLGNQYEIVWAIIEPDALRLESMCEWSFPEEVFSFSENKPVSAEIIF